MSWVAGVSLGLLLGLILLIAIPRTLGGTAAASTGEAVTTSAATGETKTDTAAPAEGTAATAATTTAATTEASDTTAAAPAGEADAAAGKAKFAGTCAACHGANGEGGMGPALKVAHDWTLDQFASAVREGKAPEKTLSAMMPHFSTEQVSDAEMANIHAFVQTLQ